MIAATVLSIALFLALIRQVKRFAASRRARPAVAAAVEPPAKQRDR